MSRYLKADTPFFDNVTGEPLAFGVIYFGNANTDPKVLANRKVPYADMALTTPLTAVQTLTAAGKLPAPVWLNGTYSVTVDDSMGVQVFADAYVSFESGSGGGGTVDAVVAGAGVEVNSTDPANPIVGSNFDSSSATASYTLAAINDNQWMDLSGSATIDITCPPESDIDLGDEFVHVISNYGDGVVTVVAGVGVTVRPPPGGTLVIPQYSTVGIKKASFAANTYIVFGPTVAA